MTNQLLLHLRIHRLRNERERMGLFAGKEKKIDEKINFLEHDYIEFRNEIDNLKKQLQTFEE